MPTTIVGQHSRPLPTGHGAHIVLTRNTDTGTLAYSAEVTDWFGTPLTLAYGDGAPSAQAAWRACDGAIRSWLARVRLAALFAAADDTWLGFDGQMGA